MYTLKWSRLRFMKASILEEIAVTCAKWSANGVDDYSEVSHPLGNHGNDRIKEFIPDYNVATSYFLTDIIRNRNILLFGLPCVIFNFYLQLRAIGL